MKGRQLEKLMKQFVGPYQVKGIRRMESSNYSGDK